VASATTYESSPGIYKSLCRKYPHKTKTNRTENVGKETKGKKECMKGAESEKDQHGSIEQEFASIIHSLC
jgi:predicted ATP-binding protein involved in virulence